jgi:hypothetical protein
LDEQPERDLEDATDFFGRLGHSSLVTLRHIHGFSQVSGRDGGGDPAKKLASKILPARNVMTLQRRLYNHSSSVQHKNDYFK